MRTEREAVFVGGCGGGWCLPSGPTDRRFSSIPRVGFVQPQFMSSLLGYSRLGQPTGEQKKYKNEEGSLLGWIIQCRLLAEYGHPPPKPPCRVSAACAGPRPQKPQCCMAGAHAQMARVGFPPIQAWDAAGPGSREGTVVCEC